MCRLGYVQFGVYHHNLFDTAWKVKPMKELLIMLVIVGIWILLQTYILPKMGIST